MVAVACALALWLAELPIRHPLCQAMLSCPQLSQCHSATRVMLSGFTSCVGSGACWAPPAPLWPQCQGTGISGRDWGWQRPPSSAPFSNATALLPPASRSPFGGCGASLTYSAADLKGAVLILLENTLCLSVRGRRRHSPVLRSRPGPGVCVCVGGGVCAGSCRPGAALTDGPGDGLVHGPLSPRHGAAALA